MLHSVKIMEISTLTLLWQKSRESNGFSKEVTKELISRIIYQQDVRVNFSILNTVCFFSFTWGRNLNPKSGAIRVLNAECRWDYDVSDLSLRHSILSIMFESTVKFGNIIHSEEEEEGLTFFSKVVRIPTLANFFVKRLLLLQIVSNAAS